MRQSAWFFCLVLCFLQPAFERVTQADDGWSVRQNRQQRQRFIRFRLKRILKRTPFSNYAFKQLWRLHASQLARLHLLREYQFLVRSKPQHLAHKAVLAQLYARMQEWPDAESTYKQILKVRPGWLAARMGYAQVLIKRNKGKEALALFRQLVPKVVGPRRETLLRMYFKVALAKKSKVAIAHALSHIKKEPWYLDANDAEGPLALARMAAQGGVYDVSIALFSGVMKERQGLRRVRVLMEMARTAIKFRKAKDALKWLAIIRKIPSLHNVFHWEMQMLEVKAHRIRQTLATLLFRLAKKWKKSKELRELMLLGKLLEEVDDLEQAAKWYARAAKLHPTERLPRARLHSVYGRLGLESKVIEQLQALHKQGLALGHHYVQLLEFHAKKSGQARLPSWDPSWKSSSACQVSIKSKKSYYQFINIFGSYRYRRKRKRKILPSLPGVKTLQCRRSTWQAYRVRHWRMWRVYLATPAARRHLNQVVVVARQLAKAHPDDWNSLSKAQLVLSELGMTKQARAIQEIWFRATTYDRQQLTSVFRVLYLSGRSKRFLSILKRLFVRPNSRLADVALLSSFGLVPVLPGEATLSLKQHEAFLGGWQKQVCPILKQSITRLLLSWSANTYQKFPIEPLEMSLILERCDGDTPILKTLIRRLTDRVRGLYQGELNLGSFLLRHRLKKAFRRFLSAAHFKRFPAKRKTMLHQLLQNDLTVVHYHFLLQLLRETREVESLTRISSLLCRQSKDVCVGLLPHVKWLVKHPKVPAFPLVALLKSVLKARAGEEYYRGWADLLLKRYWSSPKALGALAEAKDLFTSPVSAQIKHLEVMQRALSMRKTTPLHLTAWRDLLYWHYTRIPRVRYRYRRYRGRRIRRKKKLSETAKKRKQLFQKILVEVTRFPHLRRSVMAFMATYYYRQPEMAIGMLKGWLKQASSPEDLLFLQFVWQRLSPGERREVLSRLLTKKQVEPGMLYQIAQFAHLVGDLKLQLKAMKQLVAQKHMHPTFLRQFVDVLDFSKREPVMAHRLAIHYLRSRPLPTLNALSRRIDTCCINRLERAWLLRSFALFVQMKGMKAARPAWSKLKARLTRRELRHLLVVLVDSKRMDLAMRLSLREVAVSLRAYRAVASVSKGLCDARHKACTVSVLHDYAVALDALGRAKKAQVMWKRYFAQAKHIEPELHFEKLGQTFWRLGMAKVALSFKVRARREDFKMSRLQAHLAIGKMLNKGRILDARVTWLLALGKEARQCRGAKHPTSLEGGTLVPQKLWKLGFSYYGPLVFFGACHWLGKPLAMRARLKQLATYLKDDTRRVIHLVGSASMDEPDRFFLANQRAEMVRKELLSLGVPYHRVRIRSKVVRRNCKGRASIARDRCLAFSRHVAIVPAPSASAFVHQQWQSINDQSWLRSDVDGDGIPDRVDACPLQHRTGLYYRRRRYRYYPFTSNRSHPFAGLYPVFRYRSHLYRKRKQQNGCPRYGRLAIRWNKSSGTLVFQAKMFSRRSTYLRYSGKKAIQQFDALRRLSPQSGAWELDIFIRRGGYGSLTPKKIAKRRAKSVKTFFRNQLKWKGELKVNLVAAPPQLPMQRVPQVRVRLVRPTTPSQKP